MATTDTTRRPNIILLGTIAVVVVIAAVMLGSRLTSTGAATSLEDGSVARVDDGLVYFVWEGGIQRIQQPAAYSDADLEQLGLTIGDPAPARLTVGEEGSHFAIYPFDGPDATFYLVDSDTLHEVQIVDVDAEDVADLPVLEELVINRVRLR